MFFIALEEDSERTSRAFSTLSLTAMLSPALKDCKNYETNIIALLTVSLQVLADLFSRESWQAEK